MTDYSKVCWYCHSTDMENKGNYVQCRSCDTTWNDLPELSNIVLLAGEDAIRNDNGRIVGHKLSPPHKRRPRTQARSGV